MYRSPALAQRDTLPCAAVGVRRAWDYSAPSGARSWWGYPVILDVRRGAGLAHTYLVPIASISAALDSTPASTERHMGTAVTSYGSMCPRSPLLPT